MLLTSSWSGRFLGYLLMRGKSTVVFYQLMEYGSPWSFLYSFFPFLIHVYFIMAMSLQAVSLDEQAKYKSFRGALTDLLNDTSLTTSFIWLDVASLQPLMLQWIILSKLPRILSCLWKYFLRYFFSCRFILSSLNIMMWVVLLTMSRRWIVPCFIWSRLRLVLFYRL